MHIEKQSKSFWGISLVCLSLAYLIKFAGPHFVEQLFIQGKFAWLNILTRIETNQPLNFYLGKMDNYWFGPMFMILMAGIFLAVSYRYLIQSNSKVFFFSLVIFLVLIKFETFFLPIYGDSASGPMIEAIWLKDHHFNYAQLFKEPNFVHGGPRVYMFSFYPSLQALLMKIIPHVKTFLFFNHVLVTLMSALTLVYFRKILLLVCQPKLALEMTFLLLFFPLFSSQAEQINMEMALTMFAVISAYHLCMKNLAWAFFFSFLSAFAKGVGIVSSATVFFIGMFLFFFDKEFRFRFKTFLWSMVAIVFVWGNIKLASSILSEQGRVSLVGYLEGWNEMASLAVVPLYGISVMLFVVGYFYERLNGKVGGFFEFLRKHYVALVSFVFAISWFGLFINSEGQMWRYRLLLFPCFLFCIFYVGYIFLKENRVLRFAILAATVFFLINSYGAMYSVDPVSIHSHEERTLEYRNDLKVQMALAKEIDEKYFGMTIGAQFTIAQILAFPELGFVQKKLDVMIYEFPCTYGLKVFTGLENLDMTNTLWVGFHQYLPEILSFMQGYPVGPKDIIVKEIMMADRKATLFMGGQYIQTRLNFVLRGMLLRKMSEGKL